MKDLRKFLKSIGFEKNLGYVSVGNIVHTFLGAILWLVIASKLNANEFGLLNYEISIATLLTSIGIMGFDTTLVSFLAKGVNKMLYEATFLIIVLAGLMVLLMMVFYPSYPVISLLLSMLLFSLVEANNLGKHSFKKYMWLMIIQRVLTLIFVPLFYFIFGIQATLYGFVLSYILTSYEFFRWLKHIRISISTLIPIKKYFIHSSILGVAKVLPYFFDKLLILPLFGLSIVGYYQFGVQVLTIVSMLPVIFYGYILPRESKKSSDDSIKVFSKFGLISSSILSILLIVSLPTIIISLFPTFIPVIFSSQVILLAGVPLTISSIYNSIFMAKEKSWEVVLGTLIFVCFQSMGIVILGNLMGIVGLSIATTLAAITQCIYLVYIGNKKLLKNKSAI